jgi:anti-sigma regulatory factor (Ser/Thr protein kinase)
MKSLREWLEQIPEAKLLTFHHLRLIESALYEACGNVLEHGYRNHAGGRIEVVWSPPQGTPEIEEAAPPMATGWFIVRDNAPSHDPLLTVSPDFSNPATRRKGRGLGVEMLRRIMTDVSYHAGTPEGNLLLMRYARGNRANARRED